MGANDLRGLALGLDDAEESAHVYAADPRVGGRSFATLAQDHLGFENLRPIPKGGSEVGDWREDTLARIRAQIMEADPEMTEERKWKKPSNPDGVPTWSHNGIVCTGETYKNEVKLTFAKGASIPDTSGLFNSSLEGNTRRAIGIHEGEEVDATAFKTLVLAAVALNAKKAKA